jgi:hypothetical protein
VSEAKNTPTNGLNPALAHNFSEENPELALLGECVGHLSDISVALHSLTREIELLRFACLNSRDHRPYSYAPRADDLARMGVLDRGPPMNRDYGVPGDGGGVFCESGVPAPYPNPPKDGDDDGCINE